MSSLAQPNNTFVVRFWWELSDDRTDQTKRWRGRVEHVQSSEGMTFRDADQLLAFIRRFVTPLELQVTNDVSAETEGGGP